MYYNCLYLIWFVLLIVDYHVCLVNKDSQCLKRTVFPYVHGTDRQTDRSQHPLMRPYTGATENAGLENAAPDCRGGKRGSSTVWKAEVSVI